MLSVVLNPGKNLSSGISDLLSGQGCSFFVLFCFCLGGLKVLRQLQDCSSC